MQMPNIESILEGNTKVIVIILLVVAALIIMTIAGTGVLSGLHIGGIFT